MTDSEKLNVIISRLDSLECDMQDMKSEIQNVKKDVSTLKHQTAKSIEELKTMDKLILDEVERVHNILDRHKADKAVHSA